MKNIIEIKNATKQFKDRIIFENINLNITAGKAYGFIGHNGCGKSVFFKCICGFALLTDGSIIVNGEIIGKKSNFIKDAGVVIEHPEFINDLSGYKNLKIIADIQKKIGETEINNTLNLVGLIEEKDKKVGKYSLGMKQKLRIAQAIMENPKILILDEPSSGLDKSSVTSLIKILKDFVTSGGTLLLTSHHQQDIDTLCDYVYEFEDRQLVKIK